MLQSAQNVGQRRSVLTTMPVLGQALCLTQLPARETLVSFLGLTVAFPADGSLAVVDREIFADGSVKLSGGACVFRYHRPRPGIVVVRISGDDAGQFGTATMDEVAKEFDQVKTPIELFIDATGALGPVTKVMEAWAAWFETNHKRLKHVDILIPPEAKVLHLTVAIARHLSRTGDLISIHLDAENFHWAVNQAAPGYAIDQNRL